MVEDVSLNYLQYMYISMTLEILKNCSTQNMFQIFHHFGCNDYFSWKIIKSVICTLAKKDVIFYRNGKFPFLRNDTEDNTSKVLIVQLQQLDEDVIEMSIQGKKSRDRVRIQCHRWWRFVAKIGNRLSYEDYCQSEDMSVNSTQEVSKHRSTMWWPV